MLRERDDTEGMADGWDLAGPEGSGRKHAQAGTMGLQMLWGWRECAVVQELRPEQCDQSTEELQTRTAGADSRGCVGGM